MVTTGFIFIEDIMKERRLVLDMKAFSIQCKDFIWDRYYWLSAKAGEMSSSTLRCRAIRPA